MVVTVEDLNSKTGNFFKLFEHSFVHLPKDRNDALLHTCTVTVQYCTVNVQYVDLFLYTYYYFAEFYYDNKLIDMFRPTRRSRIKKTIGVYQVLPTSIILPNYFNYKCMSHIVLYFLSNSSMNFFYSRFFRIGFFPLRTRADILQTYFFKVSIFIIRPNG